MTQPELIQTKPQPVEYTKSGMLHRNHGHWTERNFHGFRQVQDIGNYGHKWMFYICGFTGPQLSDGSDGIGHVQMFDQSETACQLDTRGRVLINGRWYDHSRWDH